jgi:hypothetical protein
MLSTGIEVALTGTDRAIPQCLERWDDVTKEQLDALVLTY